MSALVAPPTPPMDSSKQAQAAQNQENNSSISGQTTVTTAAASASPAGGVSAATWTPSPTAAPFYPSFTPFFAPGQPGQPVQIPPQAQFYDPNFAAQWAAAYHQMMSQQQFAHPLPQMHPALQMPTLPFPQQVQLPFVPNASPRANHQVPPQPGMPDSYHGFHPYRRPGRQNTSQDSSTPSTPTNQHQQQPDWARTGIGAPPPFHPPYARGEASSSQSSLGGSSTSSSNRRPRVSSNNSNPSSGTPPASLRGRSGSATSTPSHHHNSSSVGGPGKSNHQLGRSSPVPPPVQPPGRAAHQRVNSSGSERSAKSAVRSAAAATPPARAASPSPAQQPSRSAAPVKPSPLSQGQSMSNVEKRMSRDDSELLVSSSGTAVPPSSGRPGGLKGRFRRAFSSRPNTSSDAASAAGSNGSPVVNGDAATADKRTKEQPGKAPLADPDAPNAPPKRSRAASLFNPRFNRSTDNISLSSTVSSASVMIRKLGTMGKLARRNTLAGITSIFKDKDKKDGADPAKSKAEPAVSLATAEFDRSFSSTSASDPDMNGLSPAAQLARAHTLRSNAQDAAERAKANLDRRAANAGPGQTGSVRGPAAGRHIYEDGRKIIVEEDDEEGSGSDTDRGHRSEDDGDNLDEEDLTARLNNMVVEEEDVDDEPWAIGVRRSLERVRQPAKGILKNPGTYDQDAYLASVLNGANPSKAPQRPRSNSYAPASQQPEPGPFARIPSPDPDHIDGLHTHKDNGSTHVHSLPRFSFEMTGIIPMASSPESSPPPSSNGHGKDRESIKDSASIKDGPGKGPYQQPSYNSSAPVLSLGVNSAPVPLIPRSATAPAKRISFAPNLSIYDTFSPLMYDRRSEPATCNRLTPALAQRIKEELNSYKMEEMEVHVASRIHTHFFV
ncbi:hypothetical protein BKA62DRAFT_767838 [Auriculariales sp. MPI-PUGE-AT-0066]|nr:hypothetical protein BKA62DRAFT_767838 [Auriculariales sp. MPI-PUGE-AT-0066]